MRRRRLYLRKLMMLPWKRRSSFLLQWVIIVVYCLLRTSSNLGYNRNTPILSLLVLLFDVVVILRGMLLFSALRSVSC